MRLTLVVVALGLTACSSSGSGGDASNVEPLPDAPDGFFPVSGIVQGNEARPGDMNGLFTVKIGPGSIHSYGLGRSLNGQAFTLHLPPGLPSSAQNGQTLGLANVIMTELGDALVTGPAQSSDGDRVIGLSPNHMLIYRGAPFVMQFGWESQFPEAGWHCGACQRGAGAPDTLTPTSCSSIVVEMGNFNSLSACNPFDP